MGRCVPAIFLYLVVILDIGVFFHTDFIRLRGFFTVTSVRQFLSKNGSACPGRVPAAVTCFVGIRDWN